MAEPTITIGYGGQSYDVTPSQASLIFQGRLNPEQAQRTTTQARQQTRQSAAPSTSGGGYYIDPETGLGQSRVEAAPGLVKIGTPETGAYSEQFIRQQLDTYALSRANRPPTPSEAKKMILGNARPGMSIAEPTSAKVVEQRIQQQIEGYGGIRGLMSMTPRTTVPYGKVSPMEQTKDVFSDLAESYEQTILKPREHLREGTPLGQFAYGFVSSPKSLLMLPRGIVETVKDPIGTIQSTFEYATRRPAEYAGSIFGTALITYGIGKGIAKLKTPKITQSFELGKQTTFGDIDIAKSRIITKIGKKTVASDIDTILTTKGKLTYGISQIQQQGKWYVGTTKSAVIGTRDIVQLSYGKARIFRYAKNNLKGLTDIGAKTLTRSDGNIIRSLGETITTKGTRGIGASIIKKIGDIPKPTTTITKISSSSIGSTTSLRLIGEGIKTTLEQPLSKSIPLPLTIKPKITTQKQILETKNIPLKRTRQTLSIIPQSALSSRQISSSLIKKTTRIETKDIIKPSTIKNIQSSLSSLKSESLSIQAQQRVFSQSFKTAQQTSFAPTRITPSQTYIPTPFIKGFEERITPPTRMLKRRPKSSRPFRYTPSLIASIGNIMGKPPKILTGFGIRPFGGLMAKRKRKKRRR